MIPAGESQEGAPLAGFTPSPAVDVLIKDRRPAYINRGALRAKPGPTSVKPSGRRQIGSARAGDRCLPGLVVCGRCGPG